MLIFQIMSFIFCLLCFIPFSFLKIYFFFSKDGTSPLYIAAQNGHEKVVDILLEEGANANISREVFTFF